MTTKVYDSKTITVERWECYGMALMMDGWELVVIRENIAYIRKEFKGRV